MAKTFFHRLMSQPHVFVISSGVLLPTGLRHCLRTAAGQPCHVVIQPAWYVKRQADQIERAIKETRQTNPGVTFSVICPTADETELLCSMGIHALHVHKNAFLDDRIFRPLTGLVPRFPAVHVANVQPFKRHRLAWGVRGVAIVTYDPANMGGPYEELEGYESVGFANFARRDGRIHLGPWLAAQTVNRVINKSSCGLILSAVEGANNASTEYLLAGRPVVTTASQGGRDELFDPRRVTVVPPESAAVERAVEAWQRQAISPEEIRESLMQKIRMHRRRFLEHLEQVTGCELLSQANVDFWHPAFVNKLRQTIEVPDVDGGQTLA